MSIHILCWWTLLYIIDATSGNSGSSKSGLGPLCMVCNDISNPLNCEQVAKCKLNQKCSIEKYKTAGGSLLHSLNCKDTKECGVPTVSGNNSDVCNTCCDGDICTINQCGNTGYPAIAGPLCYQCPHKVDHPADCDRIHLCDSNEVCGVNELPDGRYEVMCREKTLCEKVEQSGICSSCCSQRLCNTGCSVHNSTLNNTTTSPTTHIPSTISSTLQSITKSTTTHIPNTIASTLQSKTTSTTTHIPSTISSTLQSKTTSPTTHIPSTISSTLQSKTTSTTTHIPSTISSTLQSKMTSTTIHIPSTILSTLHSTTASPTTHTPSTISSTLQSSTTSPTTHIPSTISSTLQSTRTTKQSTVRLTTPSTIRTTAAGTTQAPAHATTQHVNSGQQCLDDSSCSTLQQTFHLVGKDVCLEPQLKYFCNNSCSLCPHLNCIDEPSCPTLIQTFHLAGKDVCLDAQLRYFCNASCALCSGTSSQLTTIVVTVPTTVTAAPCQDDVSCKDLASYFMKDHSSICSDKYYKNFCNSTCGLCSGNTPSTTHSAVLNYCSMNPCKNGQCVNTGAGYTCTCSNGYQGNNCDIVNVCEQMVDICNTGRCISAPSGSMHCDCDSGFTGYRCDVNVNECANSPCVHGQCVDLVGAYGCICSPGYTGHDCDNDINECAGTPCGHGTCTDLVAGYSCKCDQGYTGTNCNIMQTVRDCKDILDMKIQSPTHDEIYVTTMAGKSVDLRCDMVTGNGGWTVIFNREDDSVDFEYRDFAEYERGFGNIRGDYWIGLQMMHNLTSDSRRYQLRVELEDKQLKQYAQVYDDFSVGSGGKYVLHIGRSFGTAGDSLSPHNGFGFSTRDKDEDANINGHCASYLGGGWWFHNCYDSCLTCPYHSPGSQSCSSMSWNALHYCVALKSSKMLVRPRPVT